MAETEVIILGAGGQLGSEWLEVLQAKQIEVQAFTSSELDITDFEKVQEVLTHLKPGLVINAAAYTKVDAAEEDWKRAFLVNAKAVAELAKLCSLLKTKLVHYSTDYVFSGSEIDSKRLPNGYPENHAFAPANQYGVSKLMGELYLREALENHLIIRVAWLCGKNGNNFIKTMLRLAQEKSEITVVNDQFGAPSFVDNVIENTINLLNLQAKGTFHIASQGLTNWYEFAKMAITLKDISTVIKPISSKEWGAKVKRPAFSKLNTAKIEALEGIKLEHWSAGLQRLVGNL